MLVSYDTNSAAERFAAVLQNRGRAVLLGTRSAGNTETLVLHPLLDGSLLELAQARYLLPDGSSIENVGLAPDIPLDVDWYNYDLPDDPQVQAAIKYIQSK